MKHFFSFITLLFFSITIFAQPDGYYDDAAGLEGEALKTALFNIIKNPNVDSYDELWDDFKTTDRDYYYENDGTVMDMYSESPTGVDPYNYNYTSDQCGTYGIEGDCYNREHSFPKSWFNEASPMYSDLFHLYPTDGKVNGQRSNYPYGEVSSPTWTSENGSKLGSCSYPGYTETVFEPIDEFKGDLARTYFYMATCYEDKISGWSSDVLNGTSYPCYSSWFINMLLEWNQNDPVSQKEIDRNNAVYDIQGNRNPYIDNSDWVGCVWATCTGLNFTSAPVTSAMENQTYTYNITYNVENDTETITGTTIPSWLTFTKDEANNKATLSGTPSNSNIGDHDVVITLEEDGESKTQSFTITVDPYSSEVTIFNKDFDDNSITSGGWTAQSIVGSGQEWITSTHDGYTDGYYAKMSGYDGTNNNENEDWLISPAVNTDDYDGEVLNFVTAMKEYGTDNTFNVYILENYDGTSTPSTATQNDITSLVNLSPGDYTFTNSGDVDLSSYTGTIYLAFKYTSGTDDGRTWEIDNIVLKGDVVESVNTLNSNIEIYPNPTNQIINISSSNIIKDINIYSVIGQKMLSFNEINKNNYSVNLSKFTKGVYFIEVKDINNTVTLKKLIKE